MSGRCFIQILKDVIIMTEKQIEIPLSKNKLILMLLGSIVFVVLGILFVVSPSTFISAIWRNSTVIFVSGSASIIFFGFCGFFIARKLADKKAGLLIDAFGITDNSSGVAGGLILWKDISEISVITIYRQKLIMLIVENPQTYIDKQTSAFKRKAMAFNYKMYGTPLSIASNGLKISFDELLKILTDNYNASRQ
jgi:hypothetical protein